MVCRLLQRGSRQTDAYQASNSGTAAPDPADGIMLVEAYMSMYSTVATC